jgi:hypothetical protein
MAETITRLMHHWAEATGLEANRNSFFMVINRLAGAGLVPIQPRGHRSHPTVEISSAGAWLLSQAAGGPLVNVVEATKRIFALPLMASEGPRRHVPEWMTLGQVFLEFIEMATSPLGREKLRRELRFINTFEGGRYSAVSYRDGSIDEYFHTMRPNQTCRVKIATLTTVPAEAFVEVAESVVRSRQEAGVVGCTIDWQTTFSGFGFQPPAEMFPQKQLSHLKIGTHKKTAPVGTSAADLRI